MPERHVFCAACKGPIENPRINQRWHMSEECQRVKHRIGQRRYQQRLQAAQRTLRERGDAA